MLGILVLVLVTGCTPINSPPVASFTRTPSSGEASLNVFFNASGSYDSDGSIVSYEWDFGDGHSGVGETPTHTFNSAGTHFVKLTVTDNEGARNSVTHSITVTAAPTVQYRVTVRQITDEFDENEYAATTKYEGKYIAVSGYVRSIGIDLRDQPYVALVGHPEDSTFDPGVNCYFTKTGPHPGLAELRKGDHVTIIAEFSFYSSLFSTVYLEKSRIE
jgi:PKD repeat protein